MSTETKTSKLTLDKAVALLHAASQNIIKKPGFYENVKVGFCTEEYDERLNVVTADGRTLERRIVNLVAITEENLDKAMELMEENPHENFAEAAGLTMSQSIFEREFGKYSSGCMVNIDVAFVAKKDGTGDVLGVTAMNRPAPQVAGKSDFFAKFMQPKTTSTEEAVTEEVADEIFE